MTLREARCLFTKAVCELILYMNSQPGYAAAMSEGMDRVTVKDPTTDHMKGSLHEIGLALDIDLYKDGVYLTNTSDHERFGVWWETKGNAEGLPLAWGGRFKDGNHYSLSYQGKK